MIEMIFLFIIGFYVEELELIDNLANCTWTRTRRLLNLSLGPKATTTQLRFNSLGMCRQTWTIVHLVRLYYFHSTIVAHKRRNVSTSLFNVICSLLFARWNKNFKLSQVQSWSVFYIERSPFESTWMLYHHKYMNTN